MLDLIWDKRCYSAQRSYQPYPNCRIFEALINKTFISFLESHELSSDVHAVWLQELVPLNRFYWQSKSAACFTSKMKLPLDIYKAFDKAPFLTEHRSNGITVQLHQLLFSRIGWCRSSSMAKAFYKSNQIKPSSSGFYLRSHLSNLQQYSICSFQIFFYTCIFLYTLYITNKNQSATPYNLWSECIVIKVE